MTKRMQDQRRQSCLRDLGLLGFRGLGYEDCLARLGLAAEQMRREEWPANSAMGQALEEVVAHALVLASGHRREAWALLVNERTRSRKRDADEAFQEQPMEQVCPGHLVTEPLIIIIINIISDKYVCMYIHMYICMYVCTYIHTL